MADKKLWPGHPEYSVLVRITEVERQMLVGVLAKASIAEPELVNALSDFCHKMDSRTMFEMMRLHAITKGEDARKV